MPVSRFGDTDPKFGLSEESSLGYIQEFNCKESMAGEAVVEDHEGYVVALALFDRRFEGSFVFVAKTGATLPVVATAQALANLTEISKAIIVTRDRKPERRDFEKYTYEYRAYEKITL